MRLHVVDGTYELYRAHFGHGPQYATSDGADRKATVGLVRSMQSLLRDATEEVTHLAVAFDNPIRSFRNDLFDAYKSDEGVPPELRAQFDAAEEALAALGVAVWSMDRFEADDAMATAAVRFASDEVQVRLMTPDKDLGQLLGDPHVVQVDRMRQRVIDGAAFEARWGIAPASMPDYLALVGDSADGIPGIPRFGAKTSATVLARYSHLEAIPPRAEDWDVQVRGAAALAENLRVHREEALLFRTLATLRTDVELPHRIEDLRYRAPDPGRWDAWRSSLGLA